VGAFNGFSVGKGHLAEAKAAVQEGSCAGADNGKPHASSFCAGGDTSERDALLAKISAAKKIEAKADW
jgi:hypothetical protein